MSSSRPLWEQDSRRRGCCRRPCPWPALPPARPGPPPARTGPPSCRAQPPLLPGLDPPPAGPSHPSSQAWTPLLSGLAPPSQARRPLLPGPALLCHSLSACALRMGTDSHSQREGPWYHESREFCQAKARHVAIDVIRCARLFSE